MKLSTQTSYVIAKYGMEEGIRALAKAGYDAIDYSFFDMNDINDDSSPWLQEDWRERAARAKEVAAECGITINQAHAPFGTSSLKPGYDEKMMGRILRSMEAASIMGVRDIVVHPRQHLPYATHVEKLFEENVAMYKSLIPYCEKWNIRVCAENMWQYDDKRKVIIHSTCARPEEFVALLDAVDSPWIVGCLDLGHCPITSVNPVDAIHALGSKRLKALHVHDVDYVDDNHNMPFTLKQDWAAIVAALAEIGYNGDFTFEADAFLWPFPLPLLPDAIAFMVKVGKYLASEIERQKQELGE